MNERSRVSTFGMVAIVTGILLNPPFLGVLFSPSSRMVSVSHILFVVLIEIVLVAAGIWAHMKRDALTARALVVRAIAASMVLLSLEIGLHIGKFTLEHFRGTTVDKRVNLSAYRDEKWARQLFEEYHETKLGFDQYIGWKAKEYHGLYINVDKEGQRRTINRETSDPTDSVFVFGGSSIWGAYVRDENTVPSQLSRILSDRGRRPIVHNFAQPGYTFTQGLLRLILLLKDGRRPGVVVFCDGFNDVLSAYNTGKEGRIGLYDELRSAIETKQLPHRKQLALLCVDFLEKRSMLYKSIDRLGLLLTGTKAGAKYDQQQRKELSAGIVREYVASIRLLDSLSRMYGFTYHCFLQPVIFTKEFPSDEERSSDPQFDDPEIRELCLSTYVSLEHLTLPHWHTLSHLFDGHTETYYSDLCHLSEAGNQLVAYEIAELTFDRNSWQHATGLH